MAQEGDAQSVGHTYAFIKTGPGNRYLKYAPTWGGLYIGFIGFPLNLLDKTYDEALAACPELKKYRPFFAPLRDIYRMSLPEWRTKVRLAVWNRATSSLEIWQATGQLQPFPRRYLFNLFNDCQNAADLQNSREWREECTQTYISDRLHVRGPEDYHKALDFLSSAWGYRFLPARRLSRPTLSESIYAPIDTLSVLQTLNRRTFVYMTDINPPAIEWPSDIFTDTTAFNGPNGSVKETGYGRFVREYLDSLVDPSQGSGLRCLTDEKRLKLICATLNPMLVETAAMLFALDIGMVIDSGRGKGRQGIDVVAVCGKTSTPEQVIHRLERIGVSLHKEAIENLRNNRTISFQCKGFHDVEGLSEKRLVEFRPMLPGRMNAINTFRGIPLQQVLELATHSEVSGFQHLHGWLVRMRDVVFDPVQIK